MMTYREKRDLWALIRFHQRIAKRSLARAELIRDYAGGSNGAYIGNAEGTARPKGVPDGDEGWRLMCELYSSAASHDQAAMALRRLMGKFGAWDPIKKHLKQKRRLQFKKGVGKSALRLVGG